MRNAIRWQRSWKPSRTALRIDLKNPLSVIATYADFGLTSVPAPTGEMLDNLTAIERNARKGMEIVNSLLLLSSARSKTDISLDKLNMERIVETTCDRIDEQIKAAGATLKKRDLWPSAVGYAPWVEAIWVNLITNAIKYGGKPPVIDLDWTNRLERLCATGSVTMGAAFRKRRSASCSSLSRGWKLARKGTGWG